MTEKPKTKATKKSTPAPAAPAEETQAPAFKEIRCWSDCKGQKVLLWHPALGVGPELQGYHKAKVLHVDLSAGSLLALVITDAIKGRYLLPLDSAAAKVK